MDRVHLANFEIEWVRERVIPLPPRCRDGVNSPYLPPCIFLAAGDPNDQCLGEASGRFHRGSRIEIVQEDNAHFPEVFCP